MLSTKKWRHPVAFSSVLSPAAVLIATNDDLLTEILLRSSVRSLLKCKSISKRWLSLITDPYFIHKHCQHNHPSIPGLFLRKLSFLRNPEFEFVSRDANVTGVPFRFLTFVDNPGGLTIRQSCNGLLCCSYFRANDSDRSYYIYNPSTKHYTTLPDSQNRKSSTTLFGSQSWKDGSAHICSISLAFDPLKSPHYKAICVLGGDTDSHRIEIYSSETASWKLSGNAFPAFYDTFSKSGVFWNGSLHWLSSGEDSLYFDVDQELMKKMPMPPIPDEQDQREIGYFGECRGHMHLIELYDPGMTQFDILEMETDYSQWNVKYRVDLGSLKIAYPEMVVMDEHDDVMDEHDDQGASNHLDFSILLVVEEDKEKREENSSLVLHIPDKVISYNLKDLSFKKIHDLSPGLHVVGSLQFQWSDAHQYKETLACV